MKSAAEVLKNKHGAIDLAKVDLAALHKVGAGHYSDTVAEGLELATRNGEWRPQSEWRFSFHRGIVRIYGYGNTLGTYPEMSLDQARDRARSELARIEAEMAPPLVEELAAYDHALAALKSGDRNAKTDVIRGFRRIAQIPVEMEKQLIVSPEKLPPAEALLKPVSEFLEPLSVRLRNCLRDEPYEIMAHLMVVSDAELLRTPNVGRKSLVEFRTALDELMKQWANEKPVASNLSFGLVVSLQQKILAGLEEQTRIAQESLSVLEQRDSIDVVLRLDCNCTEAPEDAPLTIDLFRDGDNFGKLLQSFSVSELIKEMIRIRTDNEGLPDWPDSDKEDPFVLIRDELRAMADLIDKAIATREGDDEEDAA